MKEGELLPLITLPEGAASILQNLGKAGFEAWAVGGCVRDSLLGIPPKDWDMCTSATPEEMKEVFAGWHTVDTGLKHGTLTVVVNHTPYEVTTFRRDGAYSDHRHPDGVTFVNRLAEDLARRDFTVNAMAWHPERGLVDLFGGEMDLRDKTIRCVGEPCKRFDEDALRILRALRFASTYGFSVEEKTSAAIHSMFEDLKDVAPERIRVELGKLLCGRGVGDILRGYKDVVTFLLPELAPTVGFDQRTRWHRWDVYTHSVLAVETVHPSEVLRLSMLLHDCGKPACFFVDEEGTGHAYGHAAESSRLAQMVLQRLRYDNATRDRVMLLVEKHDLPLKPEPVLLTKNLHQIGEEALRQLIEVQRADRIASGTRTVSEMDAWAGEMNLALDKLLASRPVFTLKQLAVNGDMLIRAGIPRGKKIGQVLQSLLEEVMAGSIPNVREDLIRRAVAINEGSRHLIQECVVPENTEEAE